MKRIFLIAIVILAALFIFFPKTRVIAPVSVVTKTPASVSVTLDSGSTVATISGIIAQNAFQALEVAAKKQNIELKTKQYDFGVFVQEVGALANTKDKSWIYFVNGTAGSVAADKQNVNAGDIVEWKYMTQSGE